MRVAGSARPALQQRRRRPRRWSARTTASLWSGTLSPALPPTVDSITPGGRRPGTCRCRCSASRPSRASATTRSRTSTCPQFFYGGEPYTRVGVVSNGYIVIGGGAAATSCSLPQTFPNAGRPNNVVALFWNDLNPSAAGTLRIGTLTDGVSTWLVIDWARVRNFSNPTTHSFEIWLGIGTAPASEEVTFAYGTGLDAGNAGSPDPGSGGNTGAENRTGTSGKNVTPPPADGSDFSVNTSPPTAGGTVSFTYDASAGPGSYDTAASMTSSVTPGITQVVQGLTVTP